jgi:hypothetical protein
VYGFGEVGPGLGERGALGICPRELFDEPDVTGSNLAEHRREFELYGNGMRRPALEG